MRPQNLESWSQFENLVTRLLTEQWGVPVQQNYVLGGHQVDAYFEHLSKSSGIERVAVELKYFQHPLGAADVHRAAAVLNDLKKRGLADRAYIVSASGFTRSASEQARALGIDLQSLESLQSGVKDYDALVALARHTRAPARTTSTNPPLFVLMPFSSDYTDLYIYGIARAAEAAGFAAKRADDIQHNRQVMAEVADNIRSARALVAETTTHNANVFYEIGFAHALRKEVVLLIRDGATPAFDVQGYNHVSYSHIHDLEQKLTIRLNTMKH